MRTAWNKGLKTPEETRKKLSEAHKGNKPSEETRKKMSEAHRLSNNVNWKGDEAGLSAKHHRIYRLKGQPCQCEHCKRTDKKKYEWANIDHEYSSSPDDYIRLCTQCHRIYDLNYNYS